MLLKTAVVKESVDQMELVNVTLDFTWKIVQVSLEKCIFFTYREKKCDGEKLLWVLGRRNNL